MASFNDISKCPYREKEEFTSANILEAEVATTGYCGGDSGHGGRTYFSLKDICSTDIDFRTTEDEYGSKRIEIMLGGDCELDTFIDSLRWAAETLERMADSKHHKVD